MQVKRLEESGEMVTPISELEPTDNFCLANIGNPGEDYMSCGERLRRRRGGATICPVHGEMH